MQKTFVAWLDDDDDGEVSVFLVRAETRKDAQNNLHDYLGDYQIMKWFIWLQCQFWYVVWMKTPNKYSTVPYERYREAVRRLEDTR